MFGVEPTGAGTGKFSPELRRDWLAFLDTYRTMFLAPLPEVRRLLGGVAASAWLHKLTGFGRGLHLCSGQFAGRLSLGFGGRLGQDCGRHHDHNGARRASG